MGKFKIIGHEEYNYKGRKYIVFYRQDENGVQIKQMSKNPVMSYDPNDIIGLFSRLFKKKEIVILSKTDAYQIADKYEDSLNVIIENKRQEDLEREPPATTEQVEEILNRMRERFASQSY
jgi:hypothetical protein